MGRYSMIGTRRRWSAHCCQRASIEIQYGLQTAPWSHDNLSMDDKVFVFGAGATKECGGPLTNEILPVAFSSLPSAMPNAIAPLNDFLCEVFHVDPVIIRREPEPSLDQPPTPTKGAVIKKSPANLRAD